MDNGQMNKLIQLTTELVSSIKEKTDVSSNHHFALTNHSITQWTYNTAQYSLKDVLKISEDCLSDENIDSNKLYKIKLQGKFLEKTLETSTKMRDNLNEEINLSDDLHGSSEIDPYNNFRWGGLSGEEAYNAFLNTD